MGMETDLQTRTIEDFGRQWTTYTDNAGFYGSVDLLADMVSPFLDLSDFSGKRVADIGSGTGRIVAMLLQAGAAQVIAVEPSDAFDVLRSNLASAGGRVVPMHLLGEELPPALELDLAVSMGVLHHIPEPDATVRAVRDALAPGGRFLVWLYAHEGNRLYLALVLPLRRLTRRLPGWTLTGLGHFLNILLDIYIFVCRFLPLPKRAYIENVIGQFDRRKRYLVIYDQLNPAYAKYYTQQEARDLLGRSGFTDVKAHHRHGYSWTVIGTKPSQGTL
jgi:SAM-dependent methyltransferase